MGISVRPGAPGGEKTAVLFMFVLSYGPRARPDHRGKNFFSPPMDMVPFYKGVIAGPLAVFLQIP